MKTKQLLFILIGMLIPWFTQTQTASAQNVVQDDSRSFDELMQAGIRFYNEGKTNPENYRNALHAFRQARRKNPDEPITAYNIARCFHRIGNCEQALNHYLFYQNATAADKDRKEVSEYIEELSKQCGQTGRLVMQCQPAHAKISFNGERGVACNGVHKLKSGEHRISITADGFEPYDGHVTIETGQKVEYAINLDTSTSEQLTSNRSDAREHKLLWTGIGLSAAGIAMTTAGGILLATAIDRDESQKSNAKFGSGIALAGIGAATVGVALWLVIDNVVKISRIDVENIEPYKQILSMKPAIQVTHDSATAGIQLTF